MIQFGSIYHLTPAARAKIASQSASRSTYDVHDALAAHMFSKTGDDRFKGTEWSPKCTDDATNVENASETMNMGTRGYDFEDAIPDYILTDDADGHDITNQADFRRNQPQFKKLSANPTRDEYIQFYKTNVQILLEYVKTNQDRVITVDG